MVNVQSGEKTRTCPNCEEIELKTERQQYLIAALDESRQQKETRLMLLDRIKLDDYRAWIDNLKFDGNSNVRFIVDNKFMQDICTSRFSNIIPWIVLEFEVINIKD